MEHQYLKCNACNGLIFSHQKTKVVENKEQHIFICATCGLEIIKYSNKFGYYSYPVEMVILK